MDLRSISNDSTRRISAIKMMLLTAIFLLGTVTISLAQNNTIPPATIEALRTDQLQFNAFRQDTSNLEIMGNLNFQNLQLQPRQKTIINLERDFSQVNTDVLSRVNPQVLANIQSQQIYSFPEVHIENRGGSDNSDQIIYQPVFTSLRPLMYDHAAEAFTSTLNFLLLSQDENSGNISNPMPIELHSDYLDNIQPNQLQIGHLNLPSSIVNISARDARDSVQIRIVTETQTDGYEKYLPVEPALSLFTERRRLQGLGIQEIPVQLSWKGSSSNETRTVNVSSSQGTVTPTAVELAYNRPTVVMLRSEGLGSANLTASTSGIRSNTVQITYTIPWLFLLFSIAGGFLGGTAKYFTLKDKSKSFLSSTIGSLSIGLLGAIAYFVLGINLLSLEVSSTFNEFAVFGISALIALFGIRKLKKTD